MSLVWHLYEKLLLQHSLVRRLLTATVWLWVFQQYYLSYVRYNSVEPPRREDGLYHAQDIVNTPFIFALVTQPTHIVAFTVLTSPIPLLCSPHLKLVEAIWLVTVQVFIGYLCYHFLYLTRQEFIIKVNDAPCVPCHAD